MKLVKHNDYMVELCEECLSWKGIYTDHKKLRIYRLTCRCKGIECSDCGKDIRPGPNSYYWPLTDDNWSHIDPSDIVPRCSECGARMQYKH